MAGQSTLRVFEDDHFTIDHSDFCVVPGYLVVRLRGPATSLSELTPHVARALGELLSRAVQAIEEAVGADRVYCLTFAELDRRLHFHLFPRTAWLRDEYWRATNSEREPINGPALFEWARSAYEKGTSLPAQEDALSRVCEKLRRHLAATSQGAEGSAT